MNDVVFEQLAASYDAAYEILLPVVENIINNKITDIDLIEHTLDQILDIHTEKGFNLFLKLVFYYSSIHLEKSFAYIDMLKEYRSEEYEQYVKKLKK